MKDRERRLEVRLTRTRDSRGAMPSTERSRSLESTGIVALSMSSRRPMPA